MNVVECRGLGKRYGRVAALVGCELAIPEGHLVAMVGPNGAGKSTLLNLIVGLAAPSSGGVSVLGGLPTGSPAALDGIAFVAQDTPLYRNLSATDMIHLTRNLNRHFDDTFARRRLNDLDIAPSRKAGKLSGGQRAQLALTLALARHPQLLVLDEPTSSLDPIARHDFMATVMTAMADDGVSVLLSSHVLAELERVADYLVLISAGRVRLDGTVDDLVHRHRLLTGPTEQPRDPRWRVIQEISTSTQTHLLVKDTSADPTADPTPQGWEERPVTLEQLVLAYLRENTAPEPSSLAGVAR
jgi:ABC-2 type transport system ATP-binding protein